MDASRIELPTRRTMPPTIVGSTVRVSSTLRPVCSPISSPMRVDDGVVELDGARHRRPAGGRSPRCHSRSYSRRMRGHDRHAVVLDQELEEVHDHRVGALDALPQPLALLLAWRSRARRRTAAGRGCSRARRRTARAARGPRRACPAPGRPRTASARRPGRSLPWRLVPALRAAQGREVQLGQRLVDEALLVVGGERLRRDLLGRLDRQVGDLVADVLDRAPGLGLDVACASARAAPRASGGPGPATSRSSVSAALRARSDDVVRLRRGPP